MVCAFRQPHKQVLICWFEYSAFFVIHWTKIDIYCTDIHYLVFSSSEMPKKGKRHNLIQVCE